MIEVGSYVGGVWISPDEGARDIHDAVTGERIGRAGNAALDAGAMLEHGRRVGGPDVVREGHPFRKRFDDLEVGRVLETGGREISLADIEHFAEFTGDTFCAHMDEDAAAQTSFFPGQVAHGYILLSMDAGLFVDPGKGPVLASTGPERVAFLQSVVPGDSISVRLTVADRKRRTRDYGEMRWAVEILWQDGATVAEYQLLTMVAG